ncbi:hypothetical protein EVAR_20020_1 [Eumeta japonica]|uniref:Uncharacterized protein n=1 Tax=Eumeta variegata TaxID=151549 RepID=A0A4C1VAA6_EUMVA|nr:hypothetical protein EVAR_20020_1 [Eumeta japonica]
MDCGARGARPPAARAWPSSIAAYTSLELRRLLFPSRIEWRRTTLAYEMQGGRERAFRLHLPRRAPHFLPRVKYAYNYDTDNWKEITPGSA